MMLQKTRMRRTTPTKLITQKRLVDFYRGLQDTEDGGYQGKQRSICSHHSAASNGNVLSFHLARYSFFSLFLLSLFIHDFFRSPSPRFTGKSLHHRPVKTRVSRSSYLAPNDLDRGETLERKKNLRVFLFFLLRVMLHPFLKFYIISQHPRFYSLFRYITFFLFFYFVLQ